MTIKRAKELLASRGFKLTKRDGEFTLSYKDKDGYHCRYYSTDLDDIRGTANAISFQGHV